MIASPFRKKRASRKPKGGQRLNSDKFEKENECLVVDKNASNFEKTMPN